MLVALDHLGEVVGRAGEDGPLLPEEPPALGCGGERLLVEGQLAVKIIIDVGDVDGFVGGKGLMG